MEEFLIFGYGIIIPKNIFEKFYSNLKREFFHIDKNRFHFLDSGDTARFYIYRCKNKVFLCINQHRIHESIISKRKIQYAHPQYLRYQCNKDLYANNIPIDIVNRLTIMLNSFLDDTYIKYDYNIKWKYQSFNCNRIL
jgi:hypothetical protein